MRLASVKCGDLVQVDKKGRVFFAGVREIGRSELQIVPLTRETFTTATAREVVGHYRKAKGSA